MLKNQAINKIRFLIPLNLYLWIITYNYFLSYVYIASFVSYLMKQKHLMCPFGVSFFFMAIAMLVFSLPCGGKRQLVGFFRILISQWY